MFDVTVFPIYKRYPGYKITTSKHHRVNKFYVTVLHFILYLNYSQSTDMNENILVTFLEKF